MSGSSGAADGAGGEGGSGGVVDSLRKRGEEYGVVGKSVSVRMDRAMWVVKCLRRGGW